VLNTSSWSQRERHGYLIGISGDGEHWCFADDAAVNMRGVQQFIPDYAGSLPETRITSVDPPGRVRSEFLETRYGRFTAFDIEGEGHYELAFDVRPRIRDAVQLIVAFENPANSDQPYVIPSVLARRQDELFIRSPLVTGLSDNTTYLVIVFGVGTDTDAVQFEHRQPMYFDSQRQIAPITDNSGRLVAATQAENQMMSTSGPSFPPEWFQFQSAPRTGGDILAELLQPAVPVDGSCAGP
jgi:hypothetical protein